MHQFANSKTCDKRRQHRVAPFLPLKRARLEGVKLAAGDGLGRDEKLAW
jgi:hypothetical protein